MNFRSVTSQRYSTLGRFSVTTLARVENVAHITVILAFPADEIVNGFRPLHRRYRRRLARVDGDKLRTEKWRYFARVQR